jgi:hypothetical protein
MTVGRLRRLLGRLRGEATAEEDDDFAPIVSVVGALGEAARVARPDVGLFVFTSP